MTHMQRTSAAAIVLVNAIVLLLNGTSVVDWSDAQVGLVMAEATTGAALLLSIYAHLKPNTKREPAAIAGAFIALSVSTTALLTGFELWHLTDAQNGLVVAVVSSTVALVAIAFARDSVTADTTPPLDG